MKEHGNFIHPKLEVKKNKKGKDNFEIIIRRLLQQIEPIVSRHCNQTRTCNNIGGGPGLICPKRDGKMDRRCFIYGEGLKCPVSTKKAPINKGEIIEKITDELDPWWIKLPRRFIRKITQKTGKKPRLEI